MVRIAQLTDLHLVERDHGARRGVRSWRLSFLSAHRPLDADDRIARATRALAAGRERGATEFPRFLADLSCRQRAVTPTLGCRWPRHGGLHRRSRRHVRTGGASRNRRHLAAKRPSHTCDPGRAKTPPAAGRAAAKSLILCRVLKRARHEAFHRAIRGSELPTLSPVRAGVLGACVRRSSTALSAKGSVVIDDPEATG